MRRRDLLTIEFKYQPTVWLVLGWMDRGLLFGALGLLVKVRIG